MNPGSQKQQQKAYFFVIRVVNPEARTGAILLSINHLLAQLVLPHTITKGQELET